jgi:hypothetical protein
MDKIEALLQEKIASNTIAVEIPLFGRLHMNCSQISFFIKAILMRAVSELELSLVDVVLDENDWHKANCRFHVSCRKAEALFGIVPSGVRVSKVVTWSITYGDDLRPKEWIVHERASQIDPSILLSTALQINQNGTLSNNVTLHKSASQHAPSPIKLPLKKFEGSHLLLMDRHCD